MGFYHLTLRAPLIAFVFRYYTWTKATEQVQPQASPDLEALDKAKGDMFEGDDCQRREKETLSD